MRPTFHQHSGSVFVQAIHAILMLLSTLLSNALIGCLGGFLGLQASQFINRPAKQQLYMAAICGATFSIIHAVMSLEAGMIMVVVCGVVGALAGAGSGKVYQVVTMEPFPDVILHPARDAKDYSL